MFHFTLTPYRSTLGLRHLIFVFASWFQITSDQNEQNEREDDDVLSVLLDVQSLSHVSDIVTCTKRSVLPSNRIDWKYSVDCQCVGKTFAITINYSIVYWFHFNRKMYDRDSTFKLARETSPDVRDAANLEVRVWCRQLWSSRFFLTASLAPIQNYETVTDLEKLSRLYLHCIRANNKKQAGNQLSKHRLPKMDNDCARINSPVIQMCSFFAKEWTLPIQWTLQRSECAPGDGWKTLPAPFCGCVVEWCVFFFTPRNK